MDEINACHNIIVSHRCEIGDYNFSCICKRCTRNVKSPDSRWKNICVWRKHYTSRDVDWCHLVNTCSLHGVTQRCRLILQYEDMFEHQKINCGLYWRRRRIVLSLCRMNSGRQNSAHAATNRCCYLNHPADLRFAKCHIVWNRDVNAGKKKNVDR